jgi:hypothetical protein
MARPGCRARCGRLASVQECSLTRTLFRPRGPGAAREAQLGRVHRLLAVATGYVVEKLVVAVRSLAVSAGPIQQRLANAWIGALVHLRPDDFDDPKERALFTSIRDAVTARGDIEATADSMSDGQALAAAGDLVELLGTICLTLAVEREPPAKTE